MRIISSLLLRRIIFLIVFLLLVIPGKAQEEPVFSKSKQDNTIESWESYLKQFPKGKYSVIARKSFDSLLFQKALPEVDNPQALEKIFKRCKTSAVADKVFTLWDKASWQDAKRTDSLFAYKNYLRRFPAGEFVKETKIAVEELIWQESCKSNSVNSYQLYLSEYPGGKYKSEARKIIESLAYQIAIEQNTIESLTEFLKNHSDHKDARKRLKQLEYDKAVKSNLLEDWVAFNDKYKYSPWSDDPKSDTQMKENAKKVIEDLLYEKIIDSPKLETCKDYLARYNNGQHNQQVIVKMEPCLFDYAVQKKNFQTYFEYLEYYPQGYRSFDIKQMLSSQIFTKLGASESFYYFEKYLKLCPGDKAELMAKMEPFMFEWAKLVNSVKSYEKYMASYSDGPHYKEVQSMLDPALFREVQKADWYSDYENYIKKFPDGLSVEKAKQRLSWLKENKAEAVIDYQFVVDESASPYSNVGRPFWPINTYFKEKSGKMGFRVSGSSANINDIYGSKWNGSSRGMIEVPAGGNVMDDYWCSSTDHCFCNGYLTRIWSGEDAGGHSIHFEQKMKLQHTGCPGKKK